MSGTIAACFAARGSKARCRLSNELPPHSVKATRGRKTPAATWPPRDDHVMSHGNELKRR
jgi:hypothetical protein